MPRPALLRGEAREVARRAVTEHEHASALDGQVRRDPGGHERPLAEVDVLAKKESAEKLATFAKNYHDALVAKGFTKEQAMQIVVATGTPSVGTMK